MGIRTSSLPNLANPSSNTLLVGVNVVNETPNNSVKITAANLKTFIVRESFLHANQSFIKANASYDQANSSANYANASFIQANSSYDWANACYTFANTTANTLSNTQIKLNSSYNFSNGLYDYSNTIYNTANSGVSLAANAFIQANAAFTVANAANVYTVQVNVIAQQAYDTANTASLNSQYANTNATVAYDTSQSALSSAQAANTNAITALNTANSALYVVANTEIKLASAYDFANTINDDLQNEINVYPIVNALKFGMTRGENVDNSVELQSAIDSISVGTIFVPAGIYGISSVNVKSGIHLKGDGKNSTIFAALSDASVIINYNADANGGNSITVSSLGLYSNGVSNVTGISISGNSSSILCDNIQLTDISINYVDGLGEFNGIVLSNCKNYSISGNYFSNCNNDIVLTDSLKGIITNNICTNNASNNITEIGTSNSNIIMGNITSKQINIVGSKTIKVNNIENAGN